MTAMTGYAEVIDSVLQEFRIDAKVTGQTTGPSVTRYELTLGPGVKVEKISRLQKNFAYATAVESVRVLAPIPGKAAVGIELPNQTRATVSMGDIVAGDHPLSIGVGKDVEGNVVSANLAKMPHLLVAGTTGSGKSSFINSMLVSLLDQDPGKVQLVLIDPKQVELTPYRSVAHLHRPVITETDEAVDALGELVDDMEARYQAMEQLGVRNIEGLDGYPYIVVVVDELADLIMQGGESIETPLIRLLQKGRAAGVHCVLATQRPSVDVVTGLIKTNVPSRLAFATASAVDSRVVLDESGAEQLLGAGDALFKPVGSRTAIRIQGALVADKEIAAAVKTATATRRVEEMVDRLHIPDEDATTGLEVLNGIIRSAEMAGQRAGDYMEKLCAPKRPWTSQSRKMELLTQAPQELGITVDTLVRLSDELKKLRDALLEG